MGISHFLYIFDQLVRHFSVGKESVFFLGHPHPAAKLHFIYVHGCPVGVVFLPLFYPFFIFPVIYAQVIYYGRILGSCFHMESVGVAFINHIVIVILYSEFVSVKFHNTGNEYFPYS